LKWTFMFNKEAYTEFPVKATTVTESDGILENDTSRKINK